MKKKEELYRAARAEVMLRRQRAVTLADERHKEAQAAIPGLADAEAAVRLHASNALLAVMKEQGDAAIAAERAASAAAREEVAQLLASHGYAQDALEPKYTCPLCGDTGVKDGHACTCIHQLARALRREDINASSPLALCSFDTFSPDKYPAETDPNLGMSVRIYMAKLLEFCRQYAESFSPKSQNLLFMGSAGLGKTHLALAVADTVLAKGYDVIYCSAGELVNHINQEHFSNEEDVWMTAVKEADLLILDDLGTEFLTPFSTSSLYELVNTRMLCHRPTIYTTNITESGVFEARYTEKVASRILAGCKIFKFFGQDIRLSR